MTDENIGQIIIDSSEIAEVWQNGRLLWPEYTYVFSNVHIVYSAGAMIYASGANYAYALATVDIYINDRFIERKTNVVLTPQFMGTHTGFSIDTNDIKAENRLKVEGLERSCTVEVYYNGVKVPSTTLSVTQQENSIDITVVTGQKIPTSQSTRTETVEVAGSRTVTISSPLYDITHPCPASGGSVILSASGQHSEKITYYEDTDYTQDIITTRTWTSGSSEQSTTTRTGTDSRVVSEQTATKYDLPTVTGGDTGFTLDGLTVTIASEGWVEYPTGRSCTFTATNGSATADVTVYQAKNSLIRSEEHIGFSEGVYAYYNRDDGWFYNHYEGGVYSDPVTDPNRYLYYNNLDSTQPYLTQYELNLYLDRFWIIVTAHGYQGNIQSHAGIGYYLGLSAQCWREAVYDAGSFAESIPFRVTKQNTADDTPTEIFDNTHFNKLPIDLETNTKGYTKTLYAYIEVDGVIRATWSKVQDAADVRLSRVTPSPINLLATDISFFIEFEAGVYIIDDADLSDITIDIPSVNPFRVELDRLEYRQSGLKNNVRAYFSCFPSRSETPTSITLLIHYFDRTINYEVVQAAAV